LVWVLFLLILSNCNLDSGVSSEVVVRAGAPDQAAVIKSKGYVGGTLRYSLPGEAETFNPLSVFETRSATLVYLTSATLLELDPLTQTVQPGLVASYDRNEEGTIFDLSIREGVHFSDGTPFTSDDVVFTFEQIYREESNNSLKDKLLINGEPIRVEKTGSTSIRLEFPEVYAPSEYLLASIPVLPKHLLDSETKPIEELWTLDTPPEKMAGLGPFVLSKYEPGIRAVFSANPHYWKVDSVGTQLPYLEQVVVEYILDRNNQLLRFQAKELELLDFLRPEDFVLLQKDPEIITQDQGASNALNFMWFNLSSKADGTPSKWFKSKKFRKAVCSAIDRSAVVENVFQGLATEALSMLSSANPVWSNPEIETCQYDPQESINLLKEDGFTLKREGNREFFYDTSGKKVAFELITKSDDVLGKVAAVVQQDLAEVGIELTIRQEEFRAVISRIMGSKDYESALLKLDIPVDPTAMNSVLFSSGSMHMWNPGQEQPESQWEADIDEWMRVQSVTIDQNERKRIFSKVQQTLADQTPLIPLVHGNVLAAWHKHLINVQPAGIFPYTIWNIWEISHNNGP